MAGKGAGGTRGRQWPDLARGGTGRFAFNSKCRGLLAAVLPHPSPLPLGEGATTSAPRITGALRMGENAADFFPLPAGEGKGGTAAGFSSRL